MMSPILRIVPNGPLLNATLEERRVITQLLEEADQKCREAAELRACAIEFEGDAATLREDVSMRHARMLSLKIRQETVTVEKGKGSRAWRKGKKKHVMKTAADQTKITGARPERMNPAQKRHEHDVDPNNDPIFGAPIAPSNEKFPVWLTRRSSKTHRGSGSAYSESYVLLPGQLPMISGRILTTIDHPNFDASQLLHIETHVHLRRKEHDAAGSCQPIPANDDRIYCMLTDDVLNSGSDRELAFSEDDNAFAAQHLNDNYTSMPLRNRMSSQGWFYDSRGSDYRYNSQITITQRRLLSDLCEMLIGSVHSM